MYKKYAILADHDLIRQHIKITNIRYAFVSKNLQEMPTVNLDYDYDLAQSFWQHVHLYEVEFNDDNDPVYVRKLRYDSEKNPINGWIDLQNYFEKDKHTYYFLSDKFYNSVVDITIAIWQWAAEWANYEVRNRIVDSIEDEEDVQ